MKKLLFVLLPICVLLSSCDSPEWHRTSTGTYIYCKANDKNKLFWDGPVIGCFADGNGTLISYGKSGDVISRDNYSTSMGVVSGWSYIPYSSYSYLGDLDDGMPDGLGVMIRNDSVFVGEFEEGLLQEGYCEIYNKIASELIPCFKGTYDDGEVTGVAKYYKNGELSFEGTLDDGVRDGVGREYDNGILIYDGYYKDNRRHGLGKLYNSNGLVYDGEWKKGKRHGYGTQYNGNGLIIYQGEWENDLYDGDGKLYKDGKCIEGEWDEGRLEKSISTTVFNEIKRSTLKWFGKDSLINESSDSLSDEPQLEASQMEFISQLEDDVNAYLTAKLKEKIEDRFDFWDLPRMLFQPWFSSDVKRATKSEKYLCEDIRSEDLQQFINNKIDYYNSNNPDQHLNYIQLNSIPTGTIVNTEAAIKIFDREAMETTDVLVGIIADIIICVVIAWIIGFLIGMFVWALIPYVAIVDIVMTIIAFVVGVFIAFFRTTPLSIELEEQICQIMVNNYMQYLDSSDIISQMLGLL